MVPDLRLLLEVFSFSLSFIFVLLKIGVVDSVTLNLKRTDPTLFPS